MADDDGRNTLHPAAAVFRDEVLGETGKENKCLKEKIRRLQPLLQHMQKVELKAVVADEVPSATTEMHGTTEVRVFRSVERSTIATTSLSQGTIEDYGDEERLVMPIESAPELLLLNCGYVGGIGVSGYGGYCVFPHKPFGRGGTLVCISEDDTARLTISVSDRVSIVGELQGLSSEDVIRYKEGCYRANHMDAYLRIPPLVSGAIICDMPGPDATFKPTSIEMALDERLQETLQVIGHATVPNAIDFVGEKSPDRILLESVVEALGDDGHKKVLADNQRLKLQVHALTNIREQMMRVDLSYGSESLTCFLEEGSLVDVGEGHSLWCIDIPDNKPDMVVDEIGCSIMHLGSTQVNTDCLTQYLSLLQEHRQPSLPFLFWREEGMAVRIPFSPNVELIGVFDLDALEDDESEDIMTDFILRLTELAMTRGRRSLHRGDDPIERFPSTFKLKIKQIQFHPASIKHVLELVGLSDELNLDEDDNGNEPNE